jgi:hypothetical protein
VQKWIDPLGMKFNAQQSIAKAVFETLEGRECMSATIGLQDGVLTIKADLNAAANIKVQLSADHRYINASVNGIQQTVRLGNDIKSMILVGSTQDDYIYVDPRLHLPAQISGDAGNDTIWGGGGVDSIDAGDGNDLVHAGGTISTGNGDDTVWATGAHDKIYAGSGNDLLIGGPGNDVIYGGSGHDTILAGGGTDKIVAGSGDTVVYGSTGNDTIVGGTGHDTLVGGAGSNSIVVSSSQTVVHAQPTNTVYKRMTKRPSRDPGSSTGSTGGTNSGSSSTGSTSTGSGNSTGSTSTPSTTPTVPPAPVPTVPPAPPVYAVPPAPPVPPAAPAPTAPTAVITQLETSIVAGEGVNVNALNSTIQNGTVLTTQYHWNFGDTGSAYNDLTGWTAGHVYDNPGTYTLTLTMTDNAGLTSVATGQVTVASDTRPTIYVDNNGSDSNSGASPDQAVKTANRAFQMAAYSSNLRILFKRGETFNVNTVLTLTGSNVYVGAYGNGANPVLNRVAGYENQTLFTTQTSSNITIEDLTFDSPNAVTSGPAPEINANAIVAGGSNIVIRNDTFLNLETAIDGELQPHGIIVQDNTAPLLTGLRGYFCWVDGDNWSILGNTVANSTRQHVVRSNDVNTSGVLIAGNNFSKELRADDPAEIMKTTINFRGGQYIYVTGNTLNDGQIGFGPDPTMSPTALTQWIVVEDNFIHNTTLGITGATDHLMARDNYFDWSGNADITVTPTDATYPSTRLMHDITIADNTGVNTGTSGQFIWVRNAALPGTLTVTNNLYVAPNLAEGLNNNGGLVVWAPDLSGFAQISGNIWPAAASGGVNYLNGYLTPEQWDAEWNVQHDQFASVTLSGSTYEATVAGITAGAVGNLPTIG